MDKKHKNKYIKWQKSFVNGNQNTIYDIKNSRILPIYSDYYWKHQNIYNIIDGLLISSKLKNNEAIWGENNLVDKLIPYQLKYNKYMNLMDDLVDKLVNPIIFAEDGSIDIDELEEDGLMPGKVFVYRQGSCTPEVKESIDNEKIELIIRIIDRTKEEMIEIINNF